MVCALQISELKICRYLSFFSYIRPTHLTFVYTRNGYTKKNVYGEVNSVKNTTINIWLNDGVY